MNTPSIWKFRATLLAASFLAVAPALHAQTQEMQVKVNVPFAFESGSQHYAAGVYTIGRGAEHIMSIQGASNSGLAMTRLAEDPQPARTGKVVFHRYGDRYFLGEIWVAGKSGHLACVKSKAESQLQISGHGTAPTGVELAVLETPR
jgi:hypothetical protein